MNRKNYVIDVTQAVVWAAVIALPAITGAIVTQSIPDALNVLKVTLRVVLPLLALYALNYYFLAPKFLHDGRRGRRKWFFLGNALALVVMDVVMLLRNDGVTQGWLDAFGWERVWAFYSAWLSFALLVQLFVILLAVGVRNALRNNELQMRIEEERRKTTEAELVWLKHQLNPHFLFNTLNNISSLTQIDPDRAQESIAQLSDLLRYALYDSEAEKVPLAAEMEFMGNYVDLMALRCNEMTTVEKDFAPPAEKAEVAPLLFISLIENAFKHGVNARYPSFVRVSMGLEGVGPEREIVFRCENSLFEKTGNDHIGSGIGLENMKRRLELLYPGRYTYAQGAEDGCYRVEVKLKL